MPDFTFNPSRPLERSALEPYYFDASERNQVVCYKAGDFETVRRNCHHDYVKYVIDQLPEVSGFLYRLLDVKLHVLQPNECTCIPGYHLDGSARTTIRDKEKGERYTLFIAGPPESATEFLDVPFTVDVDPSWDFKELSHNVSKKVPLDAPSYHIPPFVPCDYDYRYLHRGTIATRPLVRLLVRQAFSNHLRPRNEIIQCVGNCTG